ncbi:hypothetical protein LVO79_06745 [Roseivivax marinus]|uniref:hypothetical protein n=1 Tax=Roseivivax marinus TaxID=1379903 RepID=UPI0004B81E06|nr:hypothetical protein [Roseivivax marinus]UMA66137.1 hypothetical protein LVO79_06745 [Roseivivax marinus]SEL06741.1 hypothetical protein SAMN05444413_105193 [Roseivivax marinus]
MPVTFFALLVLFVIAAAAVTVWAFSALGAATMLPVLIVAALALRWGLGHVAYDDTHI